jgi:hypothetical protein
MTLCWPWPSEGSCRTGRLARYLFKCSRQVGCYKNMHHIPIMLITADLFRLAQRASLHLYCVSIKLGITAPQKKKLLWNSKLFPWANTYSTQISKVPLLCISLSNYNSLYPWRSPSRMGKKQVAIIGSGPAGPVSAFALNNLYVWWMVLGWFCSFGGLCLSAHSVRSVLPFKSQGLTWHQ